VRKNELRGFGAFIYACEGTKLRRDFRGENTFVYALDVTNSDPRIIATYVRFLVEVLELDKKRIKGQLFTYDKALERKLRVSWSNYSGIPLSQFQKTIHLKAKGSKYKPNPLGTFKVRYSSKNDWFRLNDIVNEFLEKGVGKTLPGYKISSLLPK